MSLLDRIRSLFRRGSPNFLRNKAGGMAWVKGIETGYGEETLNGRAVKTIQAESDGFWYIDPPQEFVSSANVRYRGSDAPVMRGCTARVISIHDDCLEPWKDIGDLSTEEAEAPAPATRNASPQEVS